MGHLRARAVWITLALAVSVLVVRGQGADERNVIIENLGLPAIDEGVLNDETHAPDTPSTRQRVALRSAVQAQATASRADATPGRLIVKFHDQTSSSDRAAAVT